jgi:hypothetical protein
MTSFHDISRNLQAPGEDSQVSLEEASSGQNAEQKNHGDQATKPQIQNEQNITLAWLDL